MARLLHVLLVAWLLLALPLAQHDAQAHALGHAIDLDMPAESCPDHSLYTPFAAALGSHGHGLPLAVCDGAGIAHRGCVDATLAPPAAYLSRAPPASPALA